MNPGRKIKKKRLEFHLSQQKLADLIGVGVQTVYRWEKGIAVPSRKSFQKLSNLFGVPVSWFFEDEYVEIPMDMGTQKAKIPRDILEAVKDKRMQRIVRFLKPILDEEE